MFCNVVCWLIGSVSVVDRGMMNTLRSKPGDQQCMMFIFLLGCFCCWVGCLGDRGTSREHLLWFTSRDQGAMTSPSLLSSLPCLSSNLSLDRALSCMRRDRDFSTGGDRTTAPSRWWPLTSLVWSHPYLLTYTNNAISSVGDTQICRIILSKYVYNLFE